MTTCISMLVILGKILLGILLFAVGLLFVALLFPIGYRIEASIDEKHSAFDDLSSFHYNIRILGIRVISSEPKKHLFSKGRADSPKKKDKQAAGPKKEKKKSHFSNGKKGLAFFTMLLSQLQDPKNKEVLKAIIDQTKYLCHHYGPRKGKACINYNLADPSYTGLATGFISCFPLSYKKGVLLTPDFVSEEGYVFGYCKIRGHIRMIHTIRCAFQLLKIRRIRQLLKARR
ncbi:hypothetical protein SAMN02910358_00137 [Lachnospiraceae bacterium XBB1006]|nr:hypothetical protein SAMN02910358_00137 [Lachnospiraceae bacterium XBB1006]